MPERNFHEPLRRPGITLIELAVGIAVAAVVGLVSAGLFKAAIKTYNYTYRETNALSGARKAFDGSGSRSGIIWTGRSAASVQSLSSSSLALIPPDKSTATFFVSNLNLYQLRLGAQTLQGPAISSASFSYYNLDAAGRVMVATSPASATFVTALLKMTGSGPNNKTYISFSGAQLRNHP